MAARPDVDKQRRDLYAISIGLLLFNLAGGSWQQSMATPVGAIHIERTWVLSAGGWIVWGYFIWRFWLFSRGSLERLGQDVRSEIARSSAFVRFTRRRLSAMRAAVETYVAKKAFAPGGYNAERVYLEKRLTELADATRGHIVFGLFGPPALLSFQYTDRSSTDDRQGAIRTFDDLPIDWDSIDKEAPLSNRTRGFITAGAIFRSLLRRHTFSDEILPVIVAISAPLVAIVRWLSHNHWFLSG